MPGAILIETGWPHMALNPNSRKDRWAVNHARQMAKTEAYYSTKSVARTFKARPGERFNVAIHAHPAIDRVRDADNLISACKAHLDGIAGALGVDDSRFNSPRVIFHAKRKRGGKLVFELESVPAAPPLGTRPAATPPEGTGAGPLRGGPASTLEQPPRESGNEA